MGNMQSVIVLPKTGAIYSGSVDEEFGLELGFENEYLASIEKYETKNPAISLTHKSFSGAKDKEETDTLTASLQPKYGYKITEVIPELSAAKKLIMKRKHLNKIARGRNQYSASIMREMAQLEKEYQAVVGGVNTNQLTIVQFVNEIIGRLEQPSYITTAFKTIPLDKLRGKIPEMGWPAVNIQVNRLSEPEINHTEFGQAEFRIFRNDVHIYTSREDRLEATIDPHATSISQGQQQVMRARELLALKECSTLLVDGTYGAIPDMAATGTAGVPRATNDATEAFVTAIVGHFNTFFNYLKYMIWNPIDYREYLSNWYNFAYRQIEQPEGYGVVPMRGLEKYGITAIISPYVPRGFVYSLTNEGAYELDGPYIVDAEYDTPKFADYNVVHDFIGYKIHNPKRFGEKFTLTGITPETEFTTNKQVYDKLAPPSDLVIKNASA